VIEEHPAYGYRRLIPELEARGEVVGHKRLRRLLNAWDLSLMRTVARPRPSGVREILHGAAGTLNLVKGWTPEPLEMLSTDFTEFHYAGGRKKAYLMALLDPASAWVPGWSVGPSANRELALRCWRAARQRLDEVAGVVVHSDQDSVYTSYEWLRTLIVEDGVVISFSENGAKDNPFVESFWSRFKGENQSLLWEAETLEELRTVVDRQMTYYNTERRHSRLAYQSPLEYLHQEGILPSRVSRN
jgi:putative transposase